MKQKIQAKPNQNKKGYVTNQEAEMYIPTPLACLKASEVSRYKPIAFQACAGHCLFGSIAFFCFFFSALVSNHHRLHPHPLTQSVSATRSCKVFKRSATGHHPLVTKWQLHIHYNPQHHQLTSSSQALWIWVPKMRFLVSKHLHEVV